MCGSAYGFWLYVDLGLQLQFLNIPVGSVIWLRVRSWRYLAGKIVCSNIFTSQHTSIAMLIFSTSETPSIDEAVWNHGI